MALSNLTFFRDDFRMTIWLLSEAALQCLLFLLLSTYVALFPTLLLISARIATFVLISHEMMRDPSFDKVKIERLTAQIPYENGSAPKKPAKKKVVILVLEARSNQYVSRHSQLGVPPNSSFQPKGPICTWLHGSRSSLSTHVAGRCKEPREMRL